ncbi:MAG: ComEA family DNA-binding protein [Actinomycetes bacterium]
MNLPELADITPQQRKGLLIVAAAALLLGAFYLYLGQGQVIESASANTPPEIGQLVTPTPTPSATTLLVIDVAGRVKHPGVYSVPTNSRAIDAIKAAGGALPGVDLSDINLAQYVVDGQQILVGHTILTTTAKGKSKSKFSTGAAIIPLNAATEAELDSLPGIGPVIAKRIIDYRMKNGPFTSLDQLRKVSGMGAAKYQGIKSHLRL